VLEARWQDTQSYNGSSFETSTAQHNIRGVLASMMVCAEGQYPYGSAHDMRARSLSRVNCTWSLKLT